MGAVCVCRTHRTPVVPTLFVSMTCMGCLCVSQTTSLTNTVCLNDLYWLSVCVIEHQCYQQCLFKWPVWVVYVCHRTPVLPTLFKWPVWVACVFHRAPVLSQCALNDLCRWWLSQNTSLTNSVNVNDLYGLSVCVTEHQSYQQYLFKWPVQVVCVCHRTPVLPTVYKWPA